MIVSESCKRRGGFSCILYFATDIARLANPLRKFYHGNYSNSKIYRTNCTQIVPLSTLLIYTKQQKTNLNPKTYLPIKT